MVPGAGRGVPEAAKSQKNAELEIRLGDKTHMKGA